MSRPSAEPALAAADPGQQGKILPVFVLGLQRSGTTWVANLICAHPRVACVEAEDHRGIHESIFFSHFAKRYGDLGHAENHRSFVEDFAASDYYVLTGIEDEWLQRSQARSYPAIFRQVMEELARRRAAVAWVEKSPHHTLLCRDLARDFPDARFICMLRRPMDLVRSRMWAFGRTPPSYPARLGVILRACAAISLYGRVQQKFVSECRRSMLVRYEDLANEREETMRRIAAFLDLAYEPAMLRSRYTANSSFDSAADRRRALSGLDCALISLFVAVLGIIPLALLSMLEARRDGRDMSAWPDWVWRRKPRPSRNSSARDGSRSEVGGV